MQSRDDDDNDVISWLVVQSIRLIDDGSFSMGAGMLMLIVLL